MQEAQRDEGRVLERLKESGGEDDGDKKIDGGRDNFYKMRELDEEVQ